MEVYALVAVAIITIALLHRKFTQKTPELDPIVVDDILDCAPMQPPSPMSTDSDELVVDPNYIK